MIKCRINVELQSVIDLTIEAEEDDDMLVEQQNDRVHHKDEEQQQSSAQSLQHVVTSWVEQPTSFSYPQMTVCPDKANLPANFKFPKRHFGKKKLVSRSFQPQWFQKLKWLHYDEARDLAFCSTAVRTGKMKNDRGFHNWKDASGDKGCFNSHEQSKCHKIAVEVIISLLKTTRDVGEMLSSDHAKEKHDNTKYLLKVFENV